MGSTRTVIVLAICYALGPIAMQILVPALPAIRADLATTLPRTQLVMSAFSLALAASMLAYGPLADRYDRKRLLLFGMAAFACGSLVGYVATSIEMLVAARVLQAIGAGATSTITRAIAADSYEGDELNRAMSTIMMVVVVGPMLAPILGGYIVEVGAWSDIMAVLLAMGLACGSLALFFLPGSRPPARAGHATRSYRGDFAAVIGNRGFIDNMSVLVAVQIGAYAFIAASPYLIIEMLGLSATRYGLIFMYLTMGYLAGSLVSRLVVARIGGARLILLATCVYVVGALVFIGFAAADVRNVPAIVGPAILLTFTNGVTQPNCGAGALASVAGSKGVAASLTGFGQIMAGAVGFQIMGYLAISSALPVAIVICACAVVAIVAARRLANRRAVAPGAP